MVFKHFESLSHLQTVLKEFIERQEKKNTQIALALATEESKRVYAIGSLDILKHLKQTVAPEQAPTKE